jgi:hypothetical protein
MRDTFTKGKSSPLSRYKVILIGLFLLAQLAFLTSESFVVKEISITGNRKVSSEFIRKLFPWKGQNLLGLPYKSSIRLLEAFTEIKSASFKVILPSGLLLSINERVPRYYFLQNTGHRIWFKVDGEGVVLDALQASPEHDLPRVKFAKPLTIGATLSPEVITNLQLALAELPPEYKRNITYFIFDRNLSFSFEYNFLRHYTLITLGDVNQIKAKVQILKRIFNWLTDERKPLTAVDLSACLRTNQARLFFLNPEDLPEARVIP